MNAYLLMLVLASAADVAVTYRNLQKGGTEKNFLPKALIAKIGFWPTALLTKAVIIGVPVIGGQFFPGVEGYYVVATILTLAAVVYSLMAGRKS
jgi:branched-subunit amino acid transport protein